MLAAACHHLLYKALPVCSPIVYPLSSPAQRVSRVAPVFLSAATLLT